MNSRRNKSRSRSQRFSYRLLLRLFPRSFRESYGDDLVWQIENGIEHKRDNAIGYWFRTHWNLAWSALGVRLDWARNTLSPWEKKPSARAILEGVADRGTRPQKADSGENMTSLPIGFSTVMGNLRHDLSFAVRMLLNHPN